MSCHVASAGRALAPAVRFALEVVQNVLAAIVQRFCERLQSCDRDRAHLHTSTLFNFFPDRFVTGEPPLGRGGDFVASDVWLDGIVNGAGHMHATVNVSHGAADVVDGLADPVNCSGTVSHVLLIT